MKMRTLLLAMAMAVTLPAFAEPDAKMTDAAKEEAATSIPDPVMFVSSHKGVFGSERLTYRVEAGETYIDNDEG